MANPIITRIQVEGNDVVSFLNGISPNFTYVRSMSQILPQNPTYISYRYDSITISQVGGDAFTFTVYTVEQVGGVSFTTLNFNDPADVVQAKTIEIYRLLVTAIFKGCCECGDTIPDCSIQYKYDEDPALLGTFKYTGSTIAFNYTTGNNQDFTGFFPIIQDGSWVFIFSKTDPTVYTVLQLSNFTDAGTHAQFDAIELNAQGTPFVVGTDFCIDFTSVGGSLVQGWQDTLDINSTLDKDNTVDGAGFDFVFDNNNSFTINSPAGSIEATPSGVSLNSGSQQVLVTPGYIDIVTPGIGSASTGWVLALTSTGHVEYVEAGTGTISSIGLFMPPAFTVSTPNPLTSDGSFTVTGAGSALEYIDGTGNLQTFPIYTVENGLHTKESPANPNVFHLGGVLIENTTITTTNGANEYALGVLGTANQDTQQPFGVANLGNGGVATFQDYGSGTRTNPSVEIVGDVDLVQPLLQLTMEGTLPSSNNTLLRLAYTGTPGLAATSVDFQFRNNNAVAANSNFISAKITNTITNFTDNSEASDFGIQLIQGGALANKLQVKSFGQLILNDYATSQFTNSTPNIDNTLTYVLAVKSDGTVWKKFAGGGGTVTSVGATGLLTTTATNPFTVSGTVTSEMNSGFLVGRYSSGLGVFEEIAIGDGLALTGGTLSADGTVPTYTVDNGLTENPAYNFQLGGPLIQDTTITGASKTWGIDFNNLSYIYGSVGEFYVSASNPSGYTDIDLWGGGGYITHVDASGSIGNVQFLPAVVSLGFSDPIGGGTIQFTPTYSRFGYFYYSGLTSIDYNIEINPAGINVKTPKVQQNAAGNGQVLTLMDATTGRAEWQNAGPSGAYDSNQGVYKDTSGANDTFMLGAPYGLGSTIKFMEERQVDIDVWTLYIDGVNPGGYVAAISNADAVDSGSALYVSSVSGNGLDASSPGGRAVNALANNAGSYAVFASNKSGIGTSTYSRDTYALEAKTQDGIPGLFQIGKPSLTASLFDIIQLRATNIDVTGGINIASQLNAIPVSNLTTKWTTYNDVSQFEIQTKPSGGSLTTHLAVKGTGQLQLNKYGQTPANFPDTPVWALGVDSSGNVVEFDSGGGGGGGGAGGRSYYLNGGTNQGTIGAITSVKQMSPIPVVGSNTDFPISSPGYVASFITDVGDPNQTVIPAGNWNFELWFSANSSGGTPNFYVELYKWDGATLTSIATSSATPEGITNGTTIDLYTTALAVPQTTLTSSDRLMVRVYVNTSGKTITFHTQDSHLCQVITTFASGIVSLNGLTGSVQTFATGTTGTDFAISSAGTIHTFNLPTASSSNTGKLSSTDWTNFNTAYTNRITSLTTTGSSGAATLSSNTLNIPNYTLSGLGGVPTSRTLTINGTALDLSADRSWTVGSVTSVSALTLGTSGTDLSSTVATGTTTPVITLNVPTASASNRGALSSADWSRFDGFKTQTININVDGSGGVITAGVKGYVRIPYACTITSWSIITNVTGGSLFFDIWRSNNAIPLVANSIVGGGTKPNIGGQITSSAPAGWTSTSLVANDVLAFNVESGATVYSWAILQLTITRS